MHAAQRAAEKVASKADEAKRKVSGRLLDSGVAKAGAAGKTDEPPRPTVNTRVHHHNPDGALHGAREAKRVARC